MGGNEPVRVVMSRIFRSLAIGFVRVWFVEDRFKSHPFGLHANVAVVLQHLL